MNIEIQTKYDIKVTNHGFSEGEDSPTITVETEKDVFHVQTANGKYSSSKGCWILAGSERGEIDFDDYAKNYQDNINSVMEVVIELANIEAKRIIKKGTTKVISKKEEIESLLLVNFDIYEDSDGWHWGFNDSLKYQDSDSHEPLEKIVWFLANERKTNYQNRENCLKHLLALLWGDKYRKAWAIDHQKASCRYRASLDK